MSLGARPSTPVVAQGTVPVAQPAPPDFHAGATAGGIRHVPLSSRRADHSVRYSQPEPGTVSAVRTPAEPVEQERPLFNRYPGAGVFESQAGEMALCADEYTYGPAGARIATGVIEQDAAQTVGQGRRCSDQDAPGTVRDGRKLDVFRLGDRREPKHACLGQGDQVDRLDTGSGGLESNRARNKRSSTMCLKRLPSVAIRASVPR